MNDAGLSLEDALATAATGDVWLFRNHVGLAVAIDDLPPLLWHAELGRSLPDVWTGERQRGVQPHLLRDAVRTWNERYGQRAWVRQLEGTVTRRHEDRLMEVIDRLDGRPFPTTAGLARQWLTACVRRREASREAIYCAEARRHDLPRRSSPPAPRVMRKQGNEGEEVGGAACVCVVLLRRHRAVPFARIASKRHH